jgi:hypothetical protein
MATTAKSKKKSAPVVPENSTPSDILAAEIVADRIDVEPSVRRIQQSGLGEEGRLVALTLFQEAVGTRGHVMRDPLQAIAAGREAEGPLAN